MAILFNHRARSDPKNNNNNKRKKKRRQLVKIKKRNQCQNNGVEKLVGDSCVQHALAL